MVRKTFSLVLVLFSCGGAVPDAEPSRADDDSGTLATALAEIGGGTRPCSDLTISYADGNGLDGWTYVEVEAGRVSVRRTQPGREEASFSGELGEAECRDIARVAAEGKLWTVRSPREFGVPDETKPQITMGASGAGSFSVQVWANDADDLPPFREARERILGLASQLSGGAVTY